MVASTGRAVALLDASEGILLWNATLPNNVTEVRTSEDGRYIAVTHGSTLSVFDREDGALLCSYDAGYTIRHNALDITRDGKHVAVGCGISDGANIGYVYVFNSANGTLLWSYDFGDAVRSLRFSGDGKYIAIGGEHSHYMKLATETGDILWSVSCGDPYISLAISYHGEYISTGHGWRNYIRLYDRNGTLLWVSTVEGMQLSMAMTDNGEYFVSGSSHHTYGSYTGVLFYSTASNIPLWRYNTAEDVKSVDMSTDGSYIVAGCYDDTIYLFGNSSNSPLWTYTTDGDIEEVSISYDGRYLAAGSKDGRLYVFSLECPKKVALDIGGDGSVEWVHAGTLRYDATIDDENTAPKFSSQLQAYIDSHRERGTSTMP